MLHDARRSLAHGAWPALFAGAAVTSAVLAVNLLGDALRDALDPRTRGGR
jgi:peptide/nickel transport system permease protein